MTVTGVMTIAPLRRRAMLIAEVAICRLLCPTVEKCLCRQPMLGSDAQLTLRQQIGCSLLHHDREVDLGLTLSGGRPVSDFL